ncbi:Protein NRT1/PTR FAMILY 5.13 [Forsythia ovata]|uniref:Protein NRT1/PTR FAMILY 5.13 n=1 Tax=Forsythia ovata TaxID=205694 RepID=A0ABD1U5E1_9LAMI
MLFTFVKYFRVHDRFLNKALLAPDGSREYKEASNASEIEEAKTLLRLLPMWATSLGYAIVLAQISTLFTEQGVTMDRSISSSIDIPAASLQCLISFSVVLLVPIYDCIFVPIARSITGSHLGITKRQRIGTGMVLCILSMVTAALGERLETAQVYGVADSPKAKSIVENHGIGKVRPELAMIDARHKGTS